MREKTLNFSEFSQCAGGERCKPFKDCDDLRKLTENGRRLSPEEASYLRSKQCNSINRVAYVCCKATAAPEPTKLPLPPICGAAFADRVRLQQQQKQNSEFNFNSKNILDRWR
jgi:hypothetical protein